VFQSTTCARDGVCSSLPRRPSQPPAERYPRAQTAGGFLLRGEMKKKLKQRNHQKRQATRTPQKRAPAGARRVGDPEEAKFAFDQLLTSQHPERAVDLARSFTRRWPQSSTAWACLGAAVYTADGSAREGQQCFQKALQLNPACVSARVGLFEGLLADPETRPRAWQYLRDMYVLPSSHRQVEMPGERRSGFDRDATLRKLWTGDPVPEQTVLLTLDGGSGDRFAFVRFASAMRERCARVCALSFPDEAPLLATCPGVDRVLVNATIESLADFDFWMPGKLALARFYEEMPPPPYLFADRQRVAVWRERLAGENMKVALLWKGGTLTTFGERRDCELSEFAPLASVSGIDFYAIQRGEGVDDPAPPGLRLQRLSADLHSWSDTAAVLTNCDLLISTDSGPLHLAGGLGVPMFSLITTRYWSWCFGEGAAFYPDMRVFRKKISEPWAPLMQTVAAELCTLAERHHASVLAYELG
jgi:hypothetical protein